MWSLLLGIHVLFWGVMVPVMGSHELVVSAMGIHDPCCGVHGSWYGGSWFSRGFMVPAVWFMVPAMWLMVPAMWLMVPAMGGFMVM